MTGCRFRVAGPFSTIAVGRFEAVAGLHRAQIRSQSENEDEMRWRENQVCSDEQMPYKYFKSYLVN